MNFFYAEDLQRLSDLTSQNLEIKATSDHLVLTLKAVVAVTHYKTLARLGNAKKGASFDKRARATTIPLLKKNACTKGRMGMLDGPPVEGYWIDGDFWAMSQKTFDRIVAIYPHDNFKKLLRLAQQLGSPDAKTFKTIADAMRDRYNQLKNKRSSEPPDFWGPEMDEDGNVLKEIRYTECEL